MKKKLFNEGIICVIIVIAVMALSVVLRIVSGGAAREYMGQAAIDSEEGLPYLTEMDSYYHLRMTEDIINYGHPGESVKDGVNWDDLSYAPEGRSAGEYSPLMAYAAAGVYKVMSAFSDVSLYEIIFYLGAVISSLAVIPAFILGKRFGGILGGFIAAVLAAINYGYFIHTIPGFYDTDMVISFASGFMMCFGCLFAESLLSADENRPDRKLTVKRIIYGVFFALSIFMLYLSWNVYSLYVGIFGLALVIYLILSALLGKKAVETRSESGGKTGGTVSKTGEKTGVTWVKSRGVTARTAALVAGLAVFVLIIDHSVIKTALSFASSVFTGSGEALFPDAYVSVSEMRKPALLAGGFTGLFQMKVLSESNIGVINAVGGLVPLMCAICSLVTMVVSLFKKKVRFDYVLICLWLLVSAVIAARGFRFIVLFAFPVAILAGTFGGKLFELMKEKKMFDYPVFAGMATVLILFPSIYGSFKAYTDSLTVLNYGIGDSVSYVRDNTTEDTIIASWWDYGYFYEYKGQRRTIFDGGSQNGMRVFWFGRALATEDENLSANIVAMLAGSGDKATEKMMEVFGESKNTLDTMISLLSLDKDSAGDKLVELGADEKTANELSQLLFPELQSDVVMLITPDMQRICGWFSRFGYWNESENTGSYFNVYLDHETFSPVDGKMGWTLGLDGKTMNFFIEETQEGYRAYTTSTGGEESEIFPVEKVITVSGGASQVYDMGAEVTDPHKALTVVIDLDYEKPLVSLMGSEVADSVFGRMYYTGGEGLENFVPDNESEGYCKLFNLNT